MCGCRENREGERSQSKLDGQVGGPCIHWIFILPAIHDATRTHPHMAKCAMCGDPTDRSPKLPQRFESRAEFCNEEFRRSEVAALVTVVVINEFGIRALR